MATSTNTSISRATGENDGTSSEDGGSAGKTNPTSTQVGSSPGNTGEQGRDMNRACKAANNRIADFETELAELREQAARAQAAAKPVKEAKAPRAARASQNTTIDPGDAVPPGVAVEEPQPLDEEDRAARDASEEHLSPG